MKFILVALFAVSCMPESGLEDIGGHAEITKTQWDTCCRLCKRKNMYSVIVNWDDPETLDCLCKDNTQIVIRTRSYDE